MSKFKPINIKEINELDELLNIANSILETTSPVIKGNPKAATILGTAIGGATGAAIAAGAGTAGIASTTLGLTGVVGLGIASTVALPVTIIVLISTGIGWFFGKNKANKKEQQKQANYCKELAEKQQKIYEKYVNLKKEYERTDKVKDDIIKKQQEKIAEYEAIFEALKNKRKNLEANLAFA